MNFKTIFPLLAVCLLASACGVSRKTAPAKPVGQHNFPAVNQGGKTAIIAHRGYWNCAAAGFAQNSIAALREAQKSGLRGSECDIHITSDDVVVVHHDSTIRGRSIRRNSYESFSACRLKNGEPVPTLDEYLTQAEESIGTMLIIELKPQYSPEREDRMVELTLEAIEKHSLMEPSRVAFISFSKHICDLLASRCPEFVNQYLGGELGPEELAADGINGLDYEKDILLKDSSIISRAHALGMSTNAWTVNSAEDMQALVSQGIDAITTNEPLLLRSILDNKEFKIK